MNYVLDACALFAVINKEAGADRVQSILSEAEAGTATVLMSIINVLEVYYGLLRDKGHDDAEEFLFSLQSSAINIVDIVTADVFHKAAYFKAQYHVSLGDSLALATSVCYNAAIVTSDHHEFDPIEQTEHIPFLWIR
jgi:PIN domain nuclease of toxin-antitoxin system